MKSYDDFEKLLEEIRADYADAARQISLADMAGKQTPIENAGALIRSERKRQGLTQKELCDLTEISFATLGKIEKGHPNTRLDTLKKVLSALGLRLWVG